MKTAVLGKGFLGKEFEKYGYTVLDKNQFTFTGDIIELHATLKDYDIIINCIGKSNTRWCEKKENISDVLSSNAVLPKMLSMYCNSSNKKFVHISTGCLYDNTEIENKETDFMSAHCFYTVSKWLGESVCNKEKDLILRPRLYFGETVDRNNLLCKIQKFNTFTCDKKDSFSSVSLIVEATTALLNNNCSGIYNVAHEGSLTIKELAGLCDITGDDITADQLRKREDLYLVNNVMSIEKLKTVYKPSTIQEAVLSNFKSIKG